MSTKELIQIRIAKSPESQVKLKDLISGSSARYPSTSSGRARVGDVSVVATWAKTEGWNPWINNSSLSIKIILEKNVRLEILDDLLSFDNLLNVNKIEHEIEFELHDNSKLFYSCKLKPSLVPDFDWENSSNSSELSKSFDLTKNLKVSLIGVNADAKVRIKCLAFGTQKLKIQTMQNHLHENTRSCLCVKNVLLDTAEIECDNKIKINTTACKTLANQINRNLIIGENAHVISKPQLEIENDDVKCKHGAATKTVDEDQLFYLQCRGLNYLEARQLLIKGFLS
jgi:Fe-S cluster assembly protein SufD